MQRQRRQRAAAGHRERPARLRHALLAEPRQGLRGLGCGDAHALHTAAQRGQQVFGVAARQHDAQAAGRLFQCLEQRIGRRSG